MMAVDPSERLTMSRTAIARGARQLSDESGLPDVRLTIDEQISPRPAKALMGTSSKSTSWSIGALRPTAVILLILSAVMTSRAEAWPGGTPIPTRSDAVDAATPSAKDCAKSDDAGPVVDAPAPFFWDDQEHRRGGAAAHRFEADDPSVAFEVSAWYYLTVVSGGDRLRVYEHTPCASRGPESLIGLSENTAWHVANVLLGRANGVAGPGELPPWARARTGSANGSSAGLIFTLAELDALTPGALGEDLRIAGTGAIISDGTVIPVRMVDAKLAAARVAAVDVFFARDLPPGSGAVTVVEHHQGTPRLDRTIGEWLNTAGYETAGRDATKHPDTLAIVEVSDVRQALAWLCGRTQQATTCNLAHTASATTVAQARPYSSSGQPPKTTPIRTSHRFQTIIE